MKRFLWFCLSGLLLLASCKKQDDNYRASGNYLIIGRLSGYCYEPCAYFYLIQHGEVRKSGAVWDYREDLPYNNLAYAGTYELVKDLEQHLPDSLFQLRLQTFGQPNSHDQGCYYVILSRDQQRYQWIIDPDLQNDSTHFLQPLTAELGNLLDRLSP